MGTDAVSTTIPSDPRLALLARPAVRSAARHAAAADPAGGPSPGALLDRIEKPRDTKEAAQAFEALFVEQLMREMRKGMPEGGLFKKGFAEKTFEQMLDRTYAGLMASRGGVGLAEVLLEAWGARAGGESA